MNASATQKARPLTLKARTAAELMTGPVVSISEVAPLAKAIATLVDRGISGAPVVDAAGRAVGVVSLSDIVVRVRNSDGCPRQSEDAPLARDVMTPTICSVRPDTPARMVIEEMVLLRVHRLFVIDGERMLVGVIAASDVIRNLTV